MLYSGIDLVEIARVTRLLQRFSHKFTNKVFTVDEQAHSQGDPQRLAGKFAAKEATMKLLGLGMPWRSIEVLADQNGKPCIVLNGPSSKRANELGIKDISLSITHSSGLAIAMAVSSVG